jgi:ionotropic glutamate receptor
MRQQRAAPVKPISSEWLKLKPNSTSMFEICLKYFKQLHSLWKEMSLNDSMDAKERAKLAVWDYPVSDKFTNMWRSMTDSELPETTEKGIQRVLNASDDPETGFAFIGMIAYPIQKSQYR